MDHRDFKETVTRPYHIGTKPPTDEYRDAFDRIDWTKKYEPKDKPKAAKGKG
jgi:hypothetical protein